MYLYDREESAKRYTEHEDEKEKTVESRMSFRVEYGQENETGTSNDGGYNGEDAEDFFSSTHVGHEPK